MSLREPVLLGRSLQRLTPRRHSLRKACTLVGQSLCQSRPYSPFMGPDLPGRAPPRGHPCAAQGQAASGSHFPPADTFASPRFP